MHQPGERWMYNTGPRAERAHRAPAGQPLETFLRERIFEPLGMRDTAFSVPARSSTGSRQLLRRETGALELHDGVADSQWSAADVPDGATGSSRPSTTTRLRPDAARRGRSGTERILSAVGRGHDHRPAHREQKAASTFFPATGRPWLGFGVSIVTSATTWRRSPDVRLDGGYGRPGLGSEGGHGRDPDDPARRFRSSRASISTSGRRPTGDRRLSARAHRPRTSQAATGRATRRGRVAVVRVERDRRASRRRRRPPSGAGTRPRTARVRLRRHDDPLQHDPIADRLDRLAHEPSPGDSRITRMFRSTTRRRRDEARLRRSSKTKVGSRARGARPNRRPRRRRARGRARARRRSADAHRFRRPGTLRTSSSKRAARSRCPRLEYLHRGGAPGLVVHAEACVDALERPPRRQRANMCTMESPVRRRRDVYSGSTTRSCACSNSGPVRQRTPRRFHPADAGAPVVVQDEGLGQCGAQPERSPRSSPAALRTPPGPVRQRG